MQMEPGEAASSGPLAQRKDKSLQSENKGEDKNRSHSSEIVYESASLEPEAWKRLHIAARAWMRQNAQSDKNVAVDQLLNTILLSIYRGVPPPDGFASEFSAFMDPKGLLVFQPDKQLPESDSIRALIDQALQEVLDAVPVASPLQQAAQDESRAEWDREMERMMNTNFGDIWTQIRITKQVDSRLMQFVHSLSKRIMGNLFMTLYKKIKLLAKALDRWHLFHAADKQEMKDMQSDSGLRRALQSFGFRVDQLLTHAAKSLDWLVQSILSWATWLLMSMFQRPWLFRILIVVVTYVLDMACEKTQGLSHMQETQAAEALQSPHEEESKGRQVADSVMDQYERIFALAKSAQFEMGLKMFECFFPSKLGKITALIESAILMAITFICRTVPHYVSGFLSGASAKVLGISVEIPAAFLTFFTSFEPELAALLYTWVMGSIHKTALSAPKWFLLVSGNAMHLYTFVAHLRSCWSHASTDQGPMSLNESGQVISLPSVRLGVEVGAATSEHEGGNEIDAAMGLQHDRRRGPQFIGLEFDLFALDPAVDMYFSKKQTLVTTKQQAIRSVSLLIYSWFSKIQPAEDRRRAMVAEIRKGVPGFPVKRIQWIVDQNLQNDPRARNSLGQILLKVVRYSSLEQHSELDPELNSALAHVFTDTKQNASQVRDTFAVWLRQALHMVRSKNSDWKLKDPEPSLEAVTQWNQRIAQVLMSRFEGWSQKMPDKDFTVQDCDMVALTLILLTKRFRDSQPQWSEDASRLLRDEFETRGALDNVVFMMLRQPHPTRSYPAFEEAEIRSILNMADPYPVASPRPPSQGECLILGIQAIRWYGHESRRWHQVQADTDKEWRVYSEHKDKSPVMTRDDLLNEKFSDYIQIYYASKAKYLLKQRTRLKPEDVVPSRVVDQFVNSTISATTKLWAKVTALFSDPITPDQILQILDEFQALGEEMSVPGLH